jgi:hypothetical protein
MCCAEPSGTSRRRVRFIRRKKISPSYRVGRAIGSRAEQPGSGADVIRQALEADLVDELMIIVSPVILGGGKRLFEGFTGSIELEQ